MKHCLDNIVSFDMGVGMELAFLAHNSYPIKRALFTARSIASGDKIMRSVNLFTPISKKFIASVAEGKSPSCGMPICKVGAKVNRATQTNSVFLPPKSLRTSPNVSTSETRLDNKDALAGSNLALMSSKDEGVLVRTKTAHALI